MISGLEIPVHSNKPSVTELQFLHLWIAARVSGE